MDKDFDFDLELDVDPNLTPAEAFGEAVSAAGPSGKPPKAPKQRRVRPKLLAGIVAAALVLALVIGLASSAFAGASTIQRSVKGLRQNPTVAFLSDLAESGTFSMELGLKELTGFDGTVSMELKNDYSNLKKARAAFDVGLALSGKQVADISLYGDMEQMILSSDALLPKQSLGVDLKNLDKNLEKSVFNPDSGSEYAMDEELYELLMQAYSKDRQQDMEALNAQGEKLWASAVKTLGKSIRANTKQDKDSETLNFGDESVKVKVLSYEADAEAVYKIALDAMQWARDSKDLRKFLETMVKIYPILMEDMDGDLDSFYEELEEAYSELKENREDFLEDNEDLLIRVSLYVSKGKNELLGLKLYTEHYRQKLEAEITWGPSLAEMNNITFKCNNGRDKYSGSYMVKTNDKKNFSSVLKLRENSRTVFEGSFQWDKKDGGFTLNIDDETSIKGTLEKLKDGYRADIRKVTAYGDEQKLNLRLELRRDAKFDKLPSYQELTKMREKDLEELIEDLEDAAYGLLLNRDVLGLVSGMMPYYW